MKVIGRGLSDDEVHIITQNDQLAYFISYFLSIGTHACARAHTLAGTHRTEIQNSFLLSSVVFGETGERVKKDHSQGYHLSFEE